MIKMLLESINSLYLWVKKERYLGWDPYDGLSGEISRKFADKKLLNIAIIQLNLYSPVNLRPLLGIQKGCSNKALALFSRAYLYLYATTEREEFKFEAKVLLKELEKQNISSNVNKFSCASYYFPIIFHLFSNRFDIFKRHLSKNISSLSGILQRVGIEMGKME